MCPALRMIATVILSAFILEAFSGCTTSPKLDSSVPLETQWNEDIQLSTANSRLLGQALYEGNQACLEWTNTGVELCFRGTGIQVKIGPSIPTAGMNPAIAVIIDDGEPIRMDLDEYQYHTLAENLPYGEHTLWVVKITEITASPTLLSSVRLQAPAGCTNAELLTPPAAPERRMLFIGDSITCGYGNLGKPSQAAFLTAEEDGLQTYAAFTAAAFGADAHYVCYSGKGVVKNVSGDSASCLPSLINMASLTTYLEWDSSAWQPDIVVVNAGTNDAAAGVDKEAFSGGVTAFLDKLRRQYPDAVLLWCYGMMNKQLDHTLQTTIEAYKSKDAQVFYLPLEDINARTGEWGAVMHPNAAAHRDRADVLIQKTKELLHW